MKVLVLERVDHIEEVLAAFIRKQFPDADINFIGNVDTVKPETVMTAMQTCDVIAAQSIFDDTTAFESMMFLYDALKINKPVYLIDGLQNLAININFKISRIANEVLIKLVKNGLELYNVYYDVFDLNNKDSDRLFKKLEYRFDAVKMWYNDKENLIWDERPFFISKRASNIEYFKPVVEAKKSVFDTLNKSEMKAFKELLTEDAQRVEEQIEDLESGRYDYDDKDTLLKEKQTWKKVLNKLGFFANH